MNTIKQHNEGDNVCHRPPCIKACLKCKGPNNKDKGYFKSMGMQRGSHPKKGYTHKPKDANTYAIPLNIIIIKRKKEKKKKPKPNQTKKREKKRNLRLT